MWNNILFFLGKCISKTLLIVNLYNYFSDGLKMCQVPDSKEKTVTAVTVSCEKLSDDGSDDYYLMLCPFIYTGLYFCLIYDSKVN